MMLRNNIAKANLFVENENGEYVVEDLDFIKRIKKKYKCAYNNLAKVKWKVDAEIIKFLGDIQNIL